MLLYATDGHFCLSVAFLKPTNSTLAMPTKNHTAHTDRDNYFTGEAPTKGKPGKPPSHEGD